MLDDENPSIRAELLRLTPSGDLLDLARGMRDMGVESLLLCSPSGRIRRVVTDRQIGHLAANPDLVHGATSAPPPVVAPGVNISSSVDHGSSIGTGSSTGIAARPGPAIPAQGTPAHADSGVRAARS